jgi:hypothetical protein
MVTAAVLCLATGLSISETMGWTNVFEKLGTVVRTATPDGFVVTDRSQPFAPASKPAPHAFVNLGGQGIAERAFETLAEAVLSASEGDTLEVRGDGPFVSEPIRLHQALTIRAGRGFRPVIRLSSDYADDTLINTRAALVLEGLELQRPAPRHQWPGIVTVERAPLYMANCRLLGTNHSNLFVPHRAGRCMVRNCEFLGAPSALYLQSGDKVLIENCVHLQSGLEVGCNLGKLTDASIVLNRNTFGRGGGLFWITLEADPPMEAAPLVVRTSANIFAGEQVITLAFPVSSAVENSPTVLPRLVAWSGEQNVYAIYRDYWGLSRGYLDPVEPVSRCRTLEEWKRLWGAREVDAVQGPVRYEGGDLVAKLQSNPDQLTCEDFRLRADSPGYRAGPDNQDVGAHVDVVGPGKAYERWKQTPEYQQWLRESGQRK